MKKSFGYIKIMLLSGLLTVTPALHALYAQNSKQDKENAKEEAIKEMVTSRRFVFQAQSATPMRGRVRQLTPEYDLIIKKDTIEAYLPYFGVAYTATYGSGEGGIKFKTSDFEYTMKDAKKGGWDITIKPKNVQDASLLTLSISKAGYTTLQVTSNNRQMISFYGYIQGIKQQ